MTKTQREFVFKCGGIAVGGNAVIMGRFVRRLQPGLWCVDGAECVGVNDLMRMA
jgi:hypothetical protein